MRVMHISDLLECSPEEYKPVMFLHASRELLSEVIQCISTFEPPKVKAHALCLE